MFARLSDIDRLFGTMNLLQKKLENIYTDYGKTPGALWNIQESSPRTNLYESGDHFEIRAELPGVRKEDLSVKIQGNYLEISGIRGSETPEGYRMHKSERGSGSFSRSFTLPADVDATRTEAVLKDGILFLSLPKAEAAKPKKIVIS